MYNEIYILFILFAFLFLFESLNINKLASFIGLVLSFAIILALNNFFYISYILILVQISALTILFGFIIMLYTTYNNSRVLENNNLIKEKNKIKKYILFSIFISCFFLYFFILLNYENSFSSFTLKIKEDFSSFFNIFSDFSKQSFFNTLSNEPLIISNLSVLLFKENFLNLFIITLILFFAIIALFFALSSHY